MEKKQLFRKESVDHIASPEELHDYMHVTNPRLWMLLSAVAVLLVGFIVLACFVKMENKVPVKIKVETLEYPETGEDVQLVSTQIFGSYKDIIDRGMEVRLGEERGVVGAIMNVDVVGYETGKDGAVVYFEMDNKPVSIEDGTYDGEIVVETSTPISFLWN